MALWGQVVSTTLHMGRCLRGLRDQLVVVAIGIGSAIEGCSSRERGEAGAFVRLDRSSSLTGSPVASSELLGRFGYSEQL